MNELIQEKRWQELTSNFTPEDIVRDLPFLTSINLVYSLLYNKEWDENIQEFSVRLLEAIKNSHPKEWASSWQYDAFLGLAYDIILKYNERYEALLKALAKTKNPPPQLLIAIASCSLCPGRPPISYEEAIKYLEIALKDYLYVDGVSLMRAIYALKKDKNNEKHWSEILKKIENSNIESPSLDPEFISRSLKK